MPGYLLGLDCGLTNTKAVVFDEHGRAVGSGSGPSEQLFPKPGWAEKDMENQWQGAVRAIRGALEDAGIDGADVAGVATTGHGDGLYVLDADAKPLRPAILSLDGRAAALADEFGSDGTAEKVLEVTAQAINGVFPPVLLAWLKRNEREVYDRIGHVLFCKDWMKVKLTGRVTTDPTEAATGFTGPPDGTYKRGALEAFGIEEVEDALPEVVPSTGVAGEVTREAAEETGLKAGTPVYGGLHDCPASAIGVGGARPGQLTMIAGTFSINEVVSEDPVKNPEIQCRNFAVPGQWMTMPNSASSATNLEWYVNNLAPLEKAADREGGGSGFDWVGAEVSQVLDGPSEILFLPFLHGSFEHPDATGVLFGMRARHDRRHVLRSLWEGVAFSHRRHVEQLRQSFEVDTTRLTGGGARSPVWAQVFADAVGVPVTVADVPEAGALGAVICAAVGAGLHDSIPAAVDAWVPAAGTYDPDPERQAVLDEAYGRYTQLVDALTGPWEEASRTGG